MTATITYTDGLTLPRGFRRVVGVGIEIGACDRHVGMVHYRVRHTGSMELDLVVLLDDAGLRSGSMPKLGVHGADTPLHLAFSVYVFDGMGRLLVTRRSLSKLTWPGVWTNSCCGHVRPGETPEGAARRRLHEELALRPAALDVVLPDFSYRATSPEGIVENEVCPVFVGRVDHDPVADPDEVAEWAWANWAGFCDVAHRAPWLLSPWAVLQVPLLLSQI
jgi:isopentenyl-diphosphate delta-isomerase type 1